MLTSCSGEGPPKTTATLAVVTFNSRTPELGGIARRKDDAVRRPLKGSGRGGRSRTARRRHSRGARVPMPSPWVEWSRPPSGERRPRAGGGAGRRASRARRLVRPTTTRSVATAVAADGELGVLLGLARSELDHPRRDHNPSLGVGTEPPEGRQGGARPGRVGVVGVVEHDHTAGAERSPRGGAAHRARSSSAATTSSAGTPSSRATATAAATLPGRPCDRHSWPISTPRTRTERSPPFSTTHTSALVSRADTRHTRAPDRARAVGQRRQAVVVDHEHGARGVVEDLGLGLEDAVLGTETLQVHGTDGRDHRHVGPDPASTARRSPRGRRCPSRPRRPRCRRPGARSRPGPARRGC